MKIGGLTEGAGFVLLLTQPEMMKVKYTEGGWQGWTEENRAAAIALASEDWYQKYGLSVSSISTGTPLTAEELRNIWMIFHPISQKPERNFYVLP